jgi:glyoxylase-like metal-dependent hydrolase (beta-lactamase superfamily II)
VLTYLAMTADQARALGDWVAQKGRNLTDIVITHGHGDHWFAAGVPCRTVRRALSWPPRGRSPRCAANLAMRPVLWDKVCPGMIPPSPVTAVTVPDNRFTVEGQAW